MKSQFIDDNVVASILMATDDDSWKIVYKHYREPFLRQMKTKYDIAYEIGLSIYPETFTSLVISLKNGMAKVLGEQKSILTFLVEYGRKTLIKAGHEMPIEDNSQKQTFLAGETLLLLLKDRHLDTFTKIVKHYSRYIYEVLHLEFPDVEEPVEEIISDTFLALKSNIEKDRLQLPLYSRLLTYTYRIARNKYLALYRSSQKWIQIKDKDELDTIFEQLAETPTEDNCFLDYISNQWPKLEALLDEPRESFKRLIEGLDDEAQQLLGLRYEENLRFREIGNRMGLKEGTVRRRHMEICRKWRRAFFKEVISAAEGSCRDYLVKYLIEKWSYCRIAKKYQKPEEEIEVTIKQHLEQWLKRYRY